MTALTELKERIARIEQAASRLLGAKSNAMREIVSLRQFVDHLIECQRGAAEEK